MQQIKQTTVWLAVAGAAIIIVLTFLDRTFLDAIVGGF